MMVVVQYLLVVLAYTLVSQIVGDWRCCDDRPVSLDLNSGTSESIADLETLGFEIVEGFTDGPADKCDWQVVFKATFDPPAYCEDRCTATCQRRMLKIQMAIDDVRRGYLTNVGNSFTNNGDKGDANNHTFDANLVIVNESFIAHANDNCDISREFTGATPTNVTIRIASGYFNIKTNEGFDKTVCNDTCLFDLSGKNDTELGAQNDFDVYLSFNKVIKAGSSRIGHGVCKARLSWECCAE